MGCGSSKSSLDELAAQNAKLQLRLSAMEQPAEPPVTPPPSAKASVLDEALFSHLASALQIPKDEPAIQQYAAALRHDGWDTPADFDDLSLDELREQYGFKAGHLKKVARTRENNSNAVVSTSNPVLLPEHPAPKAQANVRGQCRLCGLDVLDTQPRQKDPETGLYQHQDCQASRAGPDALLSTPSSTSLVSERAVSDPKVKAAAVSEGADAEVADIIAAAETARASGIADAKRRAEESLSAAQNANAKAAAAEAEVAAIVAAASAAREAVIAEAKRRAEESLAKAQNDAAQIAAAAQFQAPLQTIDHETASAASGSTRSRTSAAPPAMTRLPAAPKTKALLPNGKHAFLSYQWDVQEQVKEIKELLNARQVKCWMDIDGGMKSDIYDSMAEGVQGAACVVCFMTQAYQDSANCKLELKFAQQSGVPIIPVMMEANFSAKGWLAILTAGSIWTPMYEKASVLDGVDKLVEQAQHVVPGMRGMDDASDAASEASDNTESFDVGAWGDNMFSLEEMRGELDRLREESATSAEASKHASVVGEEGVLHCPLPAMVPTLPPGLFVTTEMQSVLDAVLSDTSTPQIGFCGMGGIGKTTVSCWVTRERSVRTKFGMVAWITLGQTPVLDSCINLLHQQLTGTALPDGVSEDQKHEFLQQAFLGRSVLLVLDDCWDVDVATKFKWIDPNTNSKILISSRIRDALDGGQIINVAAPSKDDAVKMLLSSAGMGADALNVRDEVAHIVEMCKRLPLTIGVAGKLIRQLAQGSDMADASNWVDIVALLEDELNDPDGCMSIEESVIRASIKAIPKKIRKHVTQLFQGFAMVPEDTFVPLPVLGMIFDACNAPSTPAATDQKPLSRIQVRRYIKVLIDRSLVLGTVDRPQLHDVMLDYVQKLFVGTLYKSAQRRLVDALRKADRSRSTATGEYTHQCVKHHISEAHDASWERSDQAISWIEDHVSGTQDVIAISAASVLPTELLAKEAEAAEMWWEAALRWSAYGLMKLFESDGGHAESAPFFLLAFTASSKVHSTSAGSGNDAGVDQGHLDLFEMYALSYIMKDWNPDNLAAYGERYKTAAASRSVRAHPLLVYSAYQTLDWFPSILGGDQQGFADTGWHLCKMLLDLANPETEAYALASEEDRAKAMPFLAWVFSFSNDVVLKSPGFSWDQFGPNGEKIVEAHDAYTYKEHHKVAVDIFGVDPHVFTGGEQLVLTLQYGCIADARRLIDNNIEAFRPIAKYPSGPGNGLTIMLGLCFVIVTHHIHGLSQHVQKLLALVGCTFDNIHEIVGNGPAAICGLFGLLRMEWHIKAWFVLHGDMPASKAIAWLESLPDNEEYYKASVTLPTHSYGQMHGGYNPVWIALAHEKVGLDDGAIRFADLQLETDLLKSGAPLCRWPQVFALACKGRVLAKQDHSEALAAFQAAITTSKESFSLVEAFALRELANYAGGGDAAVQAGRALAIKLKTFEGRMTQAEFDGLNIGP